MPDNQEPVFLFPAPSDKRRLWEKVLYFDNRLAEQPPNNSAHNLSPELLWIYTCIIVMCITCTFGTIKKGERGFLFWFLTETNPSQAAGLQSSRLGGFSTFRALASLNSRASGPFCLALTIYDQGTDTKTAPKTGIYSIWSWPAFQYFVSMDSLFLPNFLVLTRFHSMKKEPVKLIFN